MSSIQQESNTGWASLSVSKRKHDMKGERRGGQPKEGEEREEERSAKKGEGERRRGGERNTPGAGFKLEDPIYLGSNDSSPHTGAAGINRQTQRGRSSVS